MNRTIRRIINQEVETRIQFPWGLKIRTFSMEGFLILKYKFIKDWIKTRRDLVSYELLYDS